MGIRYDAYSDEELFDLLNKEKRHREKAFAELYSRYSARVYAYCRKFIGNIEEAEDVFQDTFVRFYQSSKDERIMTNVPAFILTIARNLCVNSLRREKNDLSFEEYMVGREPRSLEKKELLELIKGAVENLPDDYREAFVLREYDGFSYNDIADITGAALSTVKVRIYRAKQKIKELLDPYMKDIAKSENFEKIKN